MCLTLLVHRENRLAKRSSVRPTLYGEVFERAKDHNLETPFCICFNSFENRKTTCNCLQPITYNKYHNLIFHQRQLSDSTEICYQGGTLFFIELEFNFFVRSEALSNFEP